MLQGAKFAMFLWLLALLMLHGHLRAHIGWVSGSLFHQSAMVALATSCTPQRTMTITRRRRLHVQNSDLSSERFHS